MSPDPPSKEVVASDGAAANGTTNVAANGTTDENKIRKPFSWTQPHPIFVIVLVGPDEQPFGLQKDFLCDRSEFYRKHFEENVTEKALEHIVKLPDATPEVFGLVQSFLYTGKITDENTNVTSYESLVGLWNLGHKLAVKGLCEHTLEAMVDCRRTTGRIPATPLLIQVWRDTPEGSSIRVLLLSWAAEYMRSSDARAEFAKSLPQEVLIPTAPRKNVHYLDGEHDEETLGAKKKNRRSSGAMLSGPGFWTRLVGPFREPVDPVEDGVPDYFDKVKRPMDLSTVKQKMDQKQYTTEEEFLNDVRQIFDNCFTYWKKGDPMWAAGERLQRTFEEKYSHMNKWIAKLGGEEGE
ncbi:hypothetical protein TrVFT333_001541 [Trichoderma virens FT-333]|nr:hypothetical protein TrVFT333_001541 [Trichoderma virens FT-333]